MTATNKPLMFDKLLANDLSSFIAKSFHHVAPAQKFSRGWHLQAIAHHLELCRRGKLRRLIITMPPRHLKSISASVAFPAFVFGQDPTARIVAVSYSSELSAKHARDCRAIMMSDWYRRIFPNTRLGGDRNAEHDFMTTQRGYRLSTSVGGTLTGRGGNLIIVDDPMKPDEAMSEARRRTACDWFDNTLYSRLDDKRTDVIIVIMQRLHLDDLVGHLLDKDEGWTVLNLPAIAEINESVLIGPNKYYYRHAGDLLFPEREPAHVLEEVKRSIGSFNFASQYQQQPVPPEGEMIRWAWFRPIDTVPVRNEGRIIQSWDTASKESELSDFSVCTTWFVKGKNYYLLDVFRKRLLFPELRRAVVEQQIKWDSNLVLIEDKSSGTALIQDLRRGGLGRAGVPKAIEPEGDKVTRAAAQSIVIEAGRVRIPAAAPWLADFRQEILLFPNGRHDDQVDSMTQFLKWADKPQQGVRFVQIGGY